jgi:tetratricopeptide (TPR) repeat protein
MTRWFGVVMALALAAGVAHGDDTATRFDHANAAFAGGRWDAAITEYEAIAREDGLSAPLLFNLGNAYLRAGRTGPAVLALERAHWLAPGDPDITANLARARTLAHLPTPAVPWWAPARRALSPDGWAWLAVAALAAASAVALLRLLRRVGRGVATAVAIVGLGAFALAATFSATLVRELDRAVVLEPDTPLRIAPFADAETRGTLPAGTLVRAGQRHERFVLVRGDEGRTGWVAEPQVSAVVPVP